MVTSIDTTLQEFAATFTSVDFKSKASVQKLENAISSIGHEISTSTWKGPPLETLKLIRIGVERIINCAITDGNLLPSAPQDSTPPMDLDSVDQDGEKSFIVQFACRLVSFLSLSSLGDDESCRDEVLGMLTYILQPPQRDYSTTLAPYLYHVIIKISSALKVVADEIWETEKNGFYFILDENNDLQCVSLRNKSSSLWIHDLWELLFNVQSKHSWIFSSNFLEKKILQNVCLGAMRMLDIDMASEFVFFPIQKQRQRPWLELLINMCLHLPEFRRHQIVPTILAWSSKLLIKLSSSGMQTNDNAVPLIGDVKHLLLDLQAALGFVAEQSEPGLLQLSHLHQAFLASSDMQLFVKSKNFLLYMSKILALEGFVKTSSLTCYLKLISAFLDNHSDNMFLVPHCVSILQKTFYHKEADLSFVSAQSVSRYMEHISNLVTKGADASTEPTRSLLTELKFHLLIFKKLDPATLKLVAPFICNCIKNLVKTTLTFRDVRSLFKMTSSLNHFLLGVAELFSEPSIAGSASVHEIQDDLQFLSCISVIFLAPSLVQRIQARYPQFAGLLGDLSDTKVIDECFVSLLSSVRSTLHCIRVVHLYCVDFVDKEVVGDKIVNFLKANINHPDLWRNFSCLAGIGLESDLADWLLGTPISSEEVYESVIYAWSNWACFLISSSNSNIAIRKEKCFFADCIDRHPILSLPCQNTLALEAARISLESFEVLLAFFEKLWSHNASGPGPTLSETLIFGLIRLFNHAPPNLTLPDSFQTLAFQLFQSQFKNVREFSIVLYPKILHKVDTLMPWQCLRSNLIQSLESEGLNQRESSLLVMKNLMVAFAPDEHQIYEDCFLTLFSAVCSGDSIVRALALEQLLSCSARVFEPLLEKAALQCIHSPQKAIRALKDLAALMKVSFQDLMDRTYPFLLPVLVHAKNDTLLSSLICVGKEPNASKVAKKLILFSGDIVAYLMVNPPVSENPIFQHYFGLVQPYSPDSVVSTESIFRSNSLMLTYNLVVLLGGVDTRSKAESAIRCVAKELSSSPNSTHYLTAFLLQNSLGLINQLQIALEDIGYLRPRSLKLKIACSLTVFIGLLGDNVARIASQVLGLLQLVLGNPFLRSAALDAWLCFVKSLPAKPLYEFFRPITVHLLGLESDLKPSQRQRVVAIFEFLVLEREEGLKHHFSHLPDFPVDPIWSRVEQAVAGYKNSEKSMTSVLQDFLRMLLQDNSALISQVLCKLKCLLDERQKELGVLLLSEEVHEIVKTLVQTLIVIINKYHMDNRNIALLCGDCLGSLGAIDPSRLKIAFELENVFDASLSLNGPEDILKFSCLLIEKHLAPSFKSTQDSKMQASISFTIQELLRFCGFTSSIITEASPQQGNRPKTIKQSSKVDLRQSLIARWRAFPLSISSTLETLVTSRYHVDPIRPSKLSYPIFEPRLTYSVWIKKLFLDLTYHASGLRVFEICSCMIDHGDTATAQLLLPHLITNILVTESLVIQELVKEFCHILIIDITSESATLREQHGLCLQMIFRLIDHISKRASICRFRYAKFVKHRNSNNTILPSASVAIANYETGFKKLQWFLNQIPQSMIASAAMRSHAYARSLMHYENYFREERKTKTPTQLQPLYLELQKIYAQLEDADALAGLSPQIIEKSLEDQIVGHEVAGRWSSAQSCYEVLHQSAHSSHYEKGILNCLQNMGHYESILMYGDGLLIQEKQSKSQLEESCLNHLVGASWRVSDWKRVAKYLDSQNYDSFEGVVGKLLLKLSQKEYVGFSQLLSEAKSRLINPLAAAGMESYQRSFEFVLQLAKLHEIETVFNWFFANSGKIGSVPFEYKLSKLDSIWNTRLRTTSPSCRESFLTLRRVLAGLIPCDNEAESSCIKIQVGKLWIQTAKETRKIGHFQASFSAILQAVQQKANHVDIQQAKLLWDQNFQHQAMDLLKVFVERDGRGSKMALKKARLLLASWKESTGEVISSTLTMVYSDLCKEFPSWEKAQFLLGHYCYKIYEYERKHMDVSTKLSLPSTQTVLLICRQYLKCLAIGSKYLYQAMPKFISLWLDLNATACDRSSVVAADFVKITEKTGSFNDVLIKYIQKMPTFQFLTALPQILSRIAHPSKSVQDCQDAIILHVLKAYPQQSLWHLMAVAKSTVKARKSRVNTIFSKLKSSGPQQEMLRKIQHAEKLTEGFMNLCDFPVTKEMTKLSMSRDFRSLLTLVVDSNVATIIPLQSSLIPTLPTPETKEAHRPFAHDLPLMNGFRDQVEIMPSLQRPRKFAILGTDGNVYNFLAKPEDDLRKDSRLMEVNCIVNRLFKKDTEARKRNLHIRTYAVIPLNEKCGLIQWIPHLQSFRGIVMKAYKERNIYMAAAEIQKVLDVKGVPAKLQAFKNILAKYPEVFYNWFLESFPEPAKWLSSREAYTSTVAAMSMLGHIVGLGDRHGENILFDELTGECVHVDLNCLFEKGKTFQVPERVPFRLTHNMVDAFGVTRVDGAFRNACEVSMGVLRNNRELLKSVLEAFLHDPCLADSNSRTSSATKTLSIISEKLEGLMEGSSISVNVQGQVDALIKEAMKLENLSQMYVGWAPYL